MVTMFTAAKHWLKQLAFKAKARMPTFSAPSRGITSGKRGVLHTNPFYAFQTDAILPMAQPNMFLRPPTVGTSSPRHHDH